MAGCCTAWYGRCYGGVMEGAMKDSIQDVNEAAIQGVIEDAIYGATEDRKLWFYLFIYMIFFFFFGKKT